MNPRTNDSPANSSPVRGVRMLLSVAGAALLVAAALYNELLLSLLAPELVSGHDTVRKVRLVELYLALGGATLIVLGRLVDRVGWIRSLAGRSWTAKGLLALSTIVLPFWVAELTLRPFVALQRKSTIFEKDDDLGWRLRPGAEDQWFGTPVKINPKGLRGPELPYAKPSGVFRVLFLGDSVTFGFGLPSHEQTFPYRVQQALRGPGSGGVEAINAGVDGYSPWQEHLFLEREGLKYEPDLVVLAFVLNDVTEKLRLVRFGGSSEGFQLAHSYGSSLERLMSHSSVVQAIRTAVARARFGPDVRQGALKQEVVEVRELVDRPEAPEIRRAWELTEDSLREIFALGRETDVPILVVVFPFLFQLEEPGGGTDPQQRVTEIAEAAGVPVLDLLPVLSDAIRERGQTPRDYFQDADHLTALGNELVGKVIADRIVREGWFRDGESPG